MLQKRIIPCLLMNENGGLVKTVKFKNPQYIGDPLNAVKIYNERQVDELIILDITASKINSSPKFKTIEKIASECFIPLSYGGGIRTIEDMKCLFSLGVEKVVLNSIAIDSPNIISEAAQIFGKQSIVVNINTKINLFRKYRLYDSKRSKITSICPIVYSKYLESLGAGEIMITSVDQDGMLKGYDIPLLKKIVNDICVPVIGCGGAGKLDDIKDALKTSVHALAAGSLFIYQKSSGSVLINYPDRNEIENLWK
jgi:cyclase